MKTVILFSLIVALQISVFVHIQSMIGYISRKSMKYFKSFMVTAVSNTLIGVTLAIFIMFDREILRAVRLDIMLILESGVIFIYMIFIKIRIVYGIIRRMKDPANYHLSFFGKKVYDKGVVEMAEVAVFFLTLPITLFSGAFFIGEMLKL